MTEFPSAPLSSRPLSSGKTLFQALIEYSADLITLLDPDGRILYQSPSVQRHLGDDRNPTAEHHYLTSTVLHPQDRERIVQQLIHLPPSVTVSLSPYRVQHANGSWCWLEGTARNLLHEPSVSAILVQARDATRRIHADQRARALESLSITLASTNTTSEVVQVILLQGLDAMGASAGSVMLVDSDRQHVKVVGSAGYATLDERPWRRFPLETAVPAADAIREGRELFLTREDWLTLYPQLQHALKSTSGSQAILPLRINGHVMGAVALSFTEDAALSETQRRYLRTAVSQCALALERGELNARLQQQERLYRKITEHSHDLVSIIALDGLTQYISPALTPMLGYAPEERLGINAFDGIHPEDLKQVRQIFQTAVGSRVPVLATYRFQHKAGHWVWLESTGVNSTDDPDIQGVVLNTRDVTVRIEAEKARQITERRLQLFGEQADILIRIFGPDGVCLYASPAAEGMLGYTAEELMSYQLKQLIHPEDYPQVKAAWEGQLDVPPHRMQRRDGGYLWVESTVRRIMDERGAPAEVHVATRDISVRQEAEEALRLQLRRFQHLVSLTADFAAQDSLEQLIQTALEHCLKLTRYDYGFFFPVGSDSLIEPLRAGEAADELFAWTIPWAKAHRVGAIGQALRRQLAFFAGPDDPVLIPPEPLPRQVWVSLAVLPILTHGTLRGFMAFGTNEPVEVDEDSRRLLLGVGEQASRVVERSVHLNELQQSREETLRALGLALEYRDYETKGHTDRVVAFTEQLGQVLGFSSTDLDALRWGAFLHDTGKVAIPDAILLKPGKLTLEEWDVIKRHPEIGYEMLQHIPSLPQITLDVVLYHQERWNGSGYPKGLTNTNIPLAARVFAVIDVYDALTSERPYKRAWTHQEAAEQLRQEAGVLLDEWVVQAFLNILDQGGDAAARQRRTGLAPM